MASRDVLPAADSHDRAKPRETCSSRGNTFATPYGEYRMELPFFVCHPGVLVTSGLEREFDVV
jgi:hypothetical protein